MSVDEDIKKMLVFSPEEEALPPEEYMALYQRKSNEALKKMFDEAERKWKEIA